MASRTPIAPVAPIAPSAVLLRLDLRQETSFSKSIAGGEGNIWKFSLLIVKNQIVVPLLQGFLWALAKDWLALACGVAKMNGAQTGKMLRLWLNKWLGASRLTGSPASLTAK